MATKIFSDEEIMNLCANPYVIKATPHNVFFSGEFKRYFYQKMCEGVPDEEFFLEVGIDPAVLGEKRIAGLKFNIRQTLKEGKELRDPVIKGTPGAHIIKPINGKTYSVLRHEIAYLRQENEFLKKIIAAGTEEAE